MDIAGFDFVDDTDLVQASLSYDEYWDIPIRLQRRWGYGKGTQKWVGDAYSQLKAGCFWLTSLGTTGNGSTVLKWMMCRLESNAVLDNNVTRNN